MMPKNAGLLLPHAAGSQHAHTQSSGCCAGPRERCGVGAHKQSSSLSAYKEAVRLCTLDAPANASAGADGASRQLRGAFAVAAAGRGVRATRYTTTTTIIIIE